MNEPVYQKESYTTAMPNDPLKYSEWKPFDDLLNEGGNVLDFSRTDFGEFTKEHTGVNLLEQYELSRGKSLKSFLTEAPRSSSVPLLKALMCEWERTRRESADHEKIQLANKCHEQLKRLAPPNPDGGAGERLKAHGFTSEYLDEQRKLLWEKVSEHPTASIGTAKELIESCCKTILDQRQKSYSKNATLPKLVDNTQCALEINPREVSESVPQVNEVKALLSNLASIAKYLAELRNSYGSGHGKSKSYQGLTERHARLAAGSALTLVEYLWHTHLERDRDRK